ncbi:PRC-barrel domain-containing protein [Rhodobacter sp. Har01]|uniref:PRC-barrel domain-containing protein n=1 Tax=Rhodobacter sp. Har01 TaxID=2883999 RepID=UPI001D07C748|nr:PRC-barrel domain-containing protein [Rhodobacter sp. Har01]MCB6179057.1 PRC-barrel domain-containing protein [Rhodobacter sp. Har01]
MDPTNSEVLDAIDFTPETLLGATVFGAEDEKIGRVTHVHGMGTDSRIVVDVGGFLGIGAKSVMVNATDLIFTRDGDGTVNALTTRTKAEVKALPEHQD